jgi:hypothetical protein
MTLDELQAQAAHDLKVNDEHLDTESLKNQEIKAKYLNHKSKFELLLYRAKGDYKRLYRDKWEYYGGKADAKIYVTKPFDLKVLKTDLSVYMMVLLNLLTIVVGIYLMRLNGNNLKLEWYNEKLL